MPFNSKRRASSSGSGNTSQQSVECLAHFLLTQFRCNEVSREEQLRQLRLLYRARFDRTSGGTFHDYNDSDEGLEKFKKDLLTIDPIAPAFKDLTSDLEHLLKQQTVKNGYGKFIWLANQLGFNVEMYAGFLERAVISLTRRLKRRPTSSEIAAEKQRLERALQNEWSQPISEPMGNYRPGNPTLKLYVDGTGYVSFEYPIGANVPFHPPRIGDVKDDKDAAEAKQAGDALPSLGSHNSRVNPTINGNKTANASAGAAAAAQSAQTYNPNGGHFFGTHYDEPVPTQPSFEESLGHLVVTIGTIFTTFLEMFLNVHKAFEQPEQQDENGNAAHSPRGKGKESYDALKRDQKKLARSTGAAAATGANIDPKPFLPSGAGGSAGRSARTSSVASPRPSCCR